MGKVRLHNHLNAAELREQMENSSETRRTVSFYRYQQLSEPQAFRDALYLALDVLGVKGRIYVAHEGINAQISVPEQHWDAFTIYLESISWLKNIRLNVAVEDDGKSFFKLNIKVKQKIVADGLRDETFDVTDSGQHLNAEQFNALTDDPNTILVDMRNYYESEVGYFEGAIRPDAVTFRQELTLVNELLKGQEEKNIVMYCTGGIRCEKASAYYKHQGFQNVFQLDGGIINYARQVEEKGLKNKFRGINFVFDERLAERISPDVVATCHQCGAPSDKHQNCVNESCHLLFIQCAACAEHYAQCCSAECRDFIALSDDEKNVLRPSKIFNGNRYPRGRYYRKGDALLG